MGTKTAFAKKPAAVKKQKEQIPVIDDYVESLKDWKKDVAKKLRKIIRAASRELTEEVKWGWPCYTAGGKCVCGFMDMKTSVNFVLYRGAELDDPDGLIEGTGKLMRHIKIHDVKDVRPPVFTKFVTQSIKLVKG